MRALDKRAAGEFGIPSLALMQSAGEAFARACIEELGGDAKNKRVADQVVARKDDWGDAGRAVGLGQLNDADAAFAQMGQRREENSRVAFQFARIAGQKHVHVRARAGKVTRGHEAVAAVVAPAAHEGNARVFGLAA